MANKVLNDDIQTGRNVYVDTARLQEDEEYKACVKKYVDEGFMPTPGDPQGAFDMLCSSGVLINPGTQTGGPAGPDTGGTL